MPYDPGNSNISGQLMAQGISQAADGISDGIQKAYQQHQENNYLDGAGSFYFGNNPEQYAKFRSGSIGTKRGMIVGQQAQQAQQVQQQQRDMQNWQQTDASTRDWYGLQDRDQQNNMRDWEATDASARAWQQINQKEEPFTPSPEVTQQAKDAGYFYAPQTPRSGTYLPMHKNGAIDISQVGTSPPNAPDMYFTGVGTAAKPRLTQGMPMDVRTGVDTELSKIKGYDQAITDKQTEIANGNLYPGWDLLKGFGSGGKSFDQQIADLKSKKAASYGTIDSLRQSAARVPIGAPTAPGTDPYGLTRPAPGAVPAPAPAATPSPTSPPAATPAATPQYKPGGVYKNRAGDLGRYNADGSWAPLPQGSRGDAGSSGSPAATGQPPNAYTTPYQASDGSWFMQNEDGSQSEVRRALPATPGPGPASAPVTADASGDAADLDPGPGTVSPQDMRGVRTMQPTSGPGRQPAAGASAGAVPNDTVDYVKGWEGWDGNTPRRDGAQLSIGYGTRARGPNDVIASRQEADARLRQELSMHAHRIDGAAEAAGLQLQPNQRTALISYDYNTGKGPAAVAKGSLPAIAKAIANGPITSGGKVLSALIDRRKGEAQHFMYGAAPIADR